MDKHIEELLNSETLIDQTEVQEFTYELPPAGPTVARFISYVELGKQPQRAFKGQEKPDCEEVRLTFELLSEQHIKEIEVDGNKTKVANKFSITLPIKFNDKAKFTKLLKLMDYGRGIKHMAKMLGEPFVLTLFHNESGEGEKKRTYVNLNEKGGEFKVAPPVMVDPLTQKSTEVPVPPAMSDLELFLWSNPTPETFGSLFIEGTKTKTIDGKEVEVSKNWLQELIMNATDFDGSALDIMLQGGESLPAMEVESEVTETAEVVEIQAKEPAKKEKAKAKEAEPVEENPLAALGLA